MPSTFLNRVAPKLVCGGSDIWGWSWAGWRCIRTTRGYMPELWNGKPRFHLRVYVCLLLATTFLVRIAQNLIRGGIKEWKWSWTHCQSIPTPRGLIPASKQQNQNQSHSFKPIGTKLCMKHPYEPLQWLLAFYWRKAVLKLFLEGSSHNLRLSFLAFSPEVVALLGVVLPGDKLVLDIGKTFGTDLPKSCSRCT